MKILNEILFKSSIFLYFKHEAKKSLLYVATPEQSSSWERCVDPYLHMIRQA